MSLKIKLLHFSIFTPLIKGTVKEKSDICPFWYSFDTVLCQFLETGTSERCFKSIVQNLRFSGFILDPLSFFLYSPFKEILERKKL